MPTAGFTLHDTAKFVESRRMEYILKNKFGDTKERGSANQSRVLNIDHGDTLIIEFKLVDEEGKQL